jgi:hypothetical protein
MENRGFEFTFNAQPVITPSFRWDLSFNIAFNKNKVTALNNNADIISLPYIIRVGQDVQSIYTFIWAGADPQTGNPLWYKDGTKKATTSDVTQVQNAIIGSASPKGFGGLTTTVSWKDLSLSAQFNYQYGNLVFNTWGFLNESDGAFFSLNQDQKVFDRRWKKPEIKQTCLNISQVTSHNRIRLQADISLKEILSGYVNWYCLTIFTRNS